MFDDLPLAEGRRESVWRCCSRVSGDGLGSQLDGGVCKKFRVQRGECNLVLSFDPPVAQQARQLFRGCSLDATLESTFVVKLVRSRPRELSQRTHVRLLFDQSLSKVHDDFLKLDVDCMWTLFFRCSWDTASLLRETSGWQNRWGGHPIAD